MPLPADTGVIAVILSLILPLPSLPSWKWGILDSKTTSLLCVCLLTMSLSDGMYPDVSLTFAFNVNDIYIRI